MASTNSLLSGRKMHKLLEGGKAFPDISRIAKDDIPRSLKPVQKVLGIDLGPSTYLGTTGKKADSGDIDIAVDVTKHDKKEIANKLRAAYGKENVRLTGTNVHLKMPVLDATNRETGQYAQLDLMLGNPAFQAWSMRGEPGRFKGVHRHIVMSSIARAQGLKWSYLNGLTKGDAPKGTQGEQDPTAIIDALLPGSRISPNNFNIDTILQYIGSKHDSAGQEKLLGAAAETLAAHYDTQLIMNESVAHNNDPDEYFLAKLRDRIVVQDMEPLIDSVNFYKPYVVEAKLRDMNHLEDLVLEEGINGIIRSIKILRAFAEGKAHAETTIKWDGSPAIVFGRLDNGKFFLTDKSGWFAKGYDGKATSAKALGQMFTNRKAEMTPERQQFVSNMQDIFDEYQKATPSTFRGMMSGDLMYYNTPGLEDHVGYVFQPNVVRYEVNKDSKLGKRIGQSKTGIVVHKYIGDMYSSTEEAIKQMQGKEVFVIPPVYVQTPSKINTKPIDKIEAFANKHTKDIQALFDPAGLKGIANIHALMYKYINNSVDTGLEKLGTDFEQWLNTEKLTDRKRENILNYLKANKVGVNALWTLIKGVMKLKDHIVSEFDSHPTDVQQSTAGQPGGEGYVVQTKQGPVKLVSRGKFTAANRALHR